MKNWNFISGWKMKIFLPEVLLIVMMSTTINAEQADEANNENPSIEFLEFLADWQDEQGRWQDPQDFIDDSLISLNEAGDKDE